MFKKFVFILLAGFLFNTSAHAAGAFDWDAADNAPVRKVFSLLQSALGALPNVALVEYNNLPSHLCSLKSRSEYVSRESAFDARVNTHTGQLAQALPAAEAILGRAQCAKIMETYQNIVQYCRAQAAPLFRGPETAAIQRFVDLLPEQNLWENHMSGYQAVGVGCDGTGEFLLAPWALPTPALKREMHAPFEQALNHARKLELDADEIKQREAPCLGFLSLNSDLRWTLLAFISSKEAIIKDGENIPSNQLILELLGRFSNGQSVDDLKEPIRAACGQHTYPQSPYKFKLGYDATQRTPGEPLLLEAAAVRQAAQEAEARARAAAIEAARPKPLLTPADHALMGEIEGRVQGINQQFAMFGRDERGYGEGERMMAFGRAGEFFKERLYQSLTEQFRVRGISTEMAPINAATHVELSKWIQDISTNLEYTNELKQTLRAGLDRAFEQATFIGFPGKGGINFFNSLVKLRKVYEKYHPTDRDNVLGTVGAIFLEYLMEHPGRCDNGAMGRGFLTEYKILTYLRDHQPNTAPGAVAGAAV